MREQYVAARDGTSLFVRSTGAGLPVVLCDGIGCDGFVLRYLRPALAPCHQVVEWHYRGHGESAAPKDPEAVGIPDLRSDLLTVMDALAVDRPVLLGFSMGVQLALDFALHHPERVAGLVLMCGSYGHLLDTLHNTRLFSTAFPFLRDAMKRWPAIGREVWRRTVSSELFYRVAVSVEVEGRLIKRPDFQPYFDHLTRMDPHLFVRMLDKVRHHTVEPRLHEIQAPTLIIAGERDTFTPVWLSRRMARQIPGAEILVVPFGTHATPLEMPELIELRLKQFLGERIGEPAVAAAASPPAAPLEVVRRQAAEP
jgi:pimeloyl-ACP methyl ester carboxylesterase